ncbi:uncharacterized protein LOC142324844 isoform X2 [Lycorma delicatula]|uniref:uncharacterized protein LOC142324844 isoform X2 n=1 Tax=Lycorma delicatula TaxID=130591 RepID=UPI003F516A1F
MALFISDRPMQKVLLKNTTRMSLHERFTFLRSNAAEGSNAAQRQRDLQQQTARNRRLAMQMERRPAVMAALKLKKRSLRQRLGLTGGASVTGGGGGFANIKDRLSLGRKARKSARGGGRLLNRTPSVQQLQPRRGRQRGRRNGGPPGGGGRGRMSRSQSMQSLNNVGKFVNRSRSRSRSRSRVRANSISNNSNNNNNSGNVRFRNKPQRGGLRRQSVGGGGGRFTQLRQRGQRGGRGGFRGRGGNNWTGGRGGRGRFDRGRGSIRGRGIGGRRGGRGAGRRRDNVPVPTKEELDNQLDQYMANSRCSLDKDLDSYMKQASTVGTASTSATAEESWD